MSKASPTFYVFHGDDDMGVDAAVQHVRAQMGEGPNADLNISEFDGETASVPEVINAVSSFPFLSDKRLVIVRGMLGAKRPKAEFDRLAESLPDLPPHARLVFKERTLLSDKHAIVKLATSAPNGYIKAFTIPKDITGWILARARDDYAVEIDPRAAQAIAAVTGSDLRRADNELVKLVSYVDGARPITEDDVAALTPYVAEANIFKMVDALADGSGPLALELLHRLLSDKSQDPFGLFGMITRQFRLLLLTREHLSTGGSPSTVASAVGVRPFVAQTLTRQSRQFTVQQLETILRGLQQHDLKMKTGRISPQLALDLFVASVAH